MSTELNNNDVLFFTDIDFDKDLKIKKEAKIDYALNERNDEKVNCNILINNCGTLRSVFRRDTNNVLIYIDNSKDFDEERNEIKNLYSETITATGCNDTIKSRCRVLIIIKPPINPKCVEFLQKWAIDVKKCSELCIDFLLQPPFDVEYIQGRIARHCEGWSKPQHQKIKPIEGFKVGNLVYCDGRNQDKFFTLCFGKMTRLELRIKEIGKRYKEFIDIYKRGRKLENYIKDFMEVLKLKSSDNIPQKYEYLFSKMEKRIPRVLLIGESGVGKTMIAKCLNDIVENHQNESLARISIPEYLCKEDDLESSMFGYMPGNHTGALPDGDSGILEQNIGKVVFLDEIGEASPAIQAKLLAYFDDYCVRPKSWSRKKTFYCPTFIVAATNQDLLKMAKEGTFRHDLLARFTDIITIPPLRERSESIDFYVDYLLQQNEINPKDENYIDEVAPDARMKLHYHDYRNGNFRELEDLLTQACMLAKQDGRRYLNAHDIVIW